MARFLPLEGCRCEGPSPPGFHPRPGWETDTPTGRSPDDANRDEDSPVSPAGLGRACRGLRATDRTRRRDGSRACPRGRTVGGLRDGPVAGFAPPRNDPNCELIDKDDWGNEGWLCSRAEGEEADGGGGVICWYIVAVTRIVYDGKVEVIVTEELLYCESDDGGRLRWRGRRHRGRHFGPGPVQGRGDSAQMSLRRAWFRGHLLHLPPTPAGGADVPSPRQRPAPGEPGGKEEPHNSARTEAPRHEQRACPGRWRRTRPPRARLVRPWNRYHASCGCSSRRGEMPLPTSCCCRRAQRTSCGRGKAGGRTDGRMPGPAYSPYISVISRRSRAATAGASRSTLLSSRFLLMVRIRSTAISASRPAHCT